MLKPINERILVNAPSIEEEVNEKGYTTEAALSSGRSIVAGEIVALAKDIERDMNYGLKVGDTIYFPRYAANEVNYKDNLYFSVSIRDVEFYDQEGE